VGPAATMLSFKPVQTESINSNMLKFISNNFNLDLIQKGPSQDHFFLIKYFCEGFAERNNFLHRNFFRFEMYFELKIWEVKVCF
jgi:hypothetical protein